MLRLLAHLTPYWPSLSHTQNALLAPLAVDDVYIQDCNILSEGKGIIWFLFQLVIFFDTATKAVGMVNKTISRGC